MLLFIVEILLFGFSFNLCQQSFVIFDKTWMSKALLILWVARLMEIIHIELPHKRAEVVVFEIFGQHMLSKRVWIFDHKAVTLLIPEHGLPILCIIHDFIGFPQKIRNLFILAALMNVLGHWLFKRFRLLRQGPRRLWPITIRVYTFDWTLVLVIALSTLSVSARIKLREWERNLRCFGGLLRVCLLRLCLMVGFPFI